MPPGLFIRGVSLPIVMEIGRMSGSVQDSGVSGSSQAGLDNGVA